jgi:hypothetical protein
MHIYRTFQEEMSIFLEINVSVILGKKVICVVCPNPNSFQDRANSLHSFKIVGKKDILRTVSNTSAYCSSDKVVTVYLI